MLSPCPHRRLEYCQPTISLRVACSSAGRAVNWPLVQGLQRRSRTTARPSDVRTRVRPSVDEPPRLLRVAAAVEDQERVAGRRWPASPGSMRLNSTIRRSSSSVSSSKRESHARRPAGSAPSTAASPRRCRSPRPCRPGGRRARGRIDGARPASLVPRIVVDERHERGEGHERRTGGEQRARGPPVHLCFRRRAGDPVERERQEQREREREPDDRAHAAQGAARA